MKRKYIKERQRLLSELITKIHALKIAKNEIEMLNDKLKELSLRLETAGSEIETLDNGAGPIQVIHAKAKTWGMYTCRDSFTEEELSAIKRLLVTDIAKKLAEANIVQFILKQAEDPFPGVSIGAKLFVVPWEQLRTNKITLERKLDDVKSFT